MLEKVIRHRKAFDQKENDHKNLNKKPFLNPSLFKSEQCENNLNVHNRPKLLSRPSLNNPALNNYSTSFEIKALQKIQSKSRFYDQPISFAYCRLYGKQLIQSYQTKLLQSSNLFLSNHQITNSLRARMLDWMVEVTESYKFIPKTYFSGVEIMDKYFQLEKDSISIERLHIIGVVSMIIASKMQQVYPFRLKTIYQKIVHRKIDIKDLIEMESKIILTLDFKTIMTTFYDYVIALIYNKHIHNETFQAKKSISPLKMQNNLIKSIQMYNQTTPKLYENNSIQSLTSPQFQRIQLLCSYLGKYICYSYDMLTSYSKTMQAEAVLSLALQIMQISPIDDELNKNIDICKQQLILIIRNFNKNFKGLGNIHKFSDEIIVKKVQDFVSSKFII